MINFELTEDQLAFQKLAREFAEREIAPKAAYHDETGEFPWEICRKAWEAGLMNTHVPEEYGGMGLSVLDGCIISEELAAGCSGIGTAMEGNTLAEAPVIVGGSEEQKKKWLAPMIDEFRLAAYAVTEPNAGSDVQGVRTTARKIGSEYVINGSKMWITNGGVADWYFVLALTDPSRGARGMSAFIVPKGAVGLEIGKKEQNLGQRASDTRALTFNDVVVPEADRIGAEGRGWFLAMSAFDHTRPVVAAAAVGVARSAMQHAIRYAKERMAFGVPIASHQAIAFMIAEMARDIDASRLPGLAGGVESGSQRAGAARGGAGQVDGGRHLHARHDRRGPDLRRLRLQSRVPGREADARRQGLPDLRGDEPDPAPHHFEGGDQEGLVGGDSTPEFGSRIPPSGHILKTTRWAAARNRPHAAHVPARVSNLSTTDTSSLRSRS